MTETAHIAIIAGEGELPRLLTDAAAMNGRPVTIVSFAEDLPDWTEGFPVIRGVFEKLGGLFHDLGSKGVTHLVFAGAMSRPDLDPSRADETFLALAPKLMAALAQGDDATLRFVASVFETNGFQILAAQEILPELLVEPGALGAARPDDRSQSDIVRATEIVAKLGEADVGQGVVVANGICLGLESIGGTDRMLEQIAALPNHLRGHGGVLFKAPKPKQDMRFDVPAIGPDTVEGAAAAGLQGIAFPAGGLLVLNRAETVRHADAAGLFIWAADA